MKIAILTAVLFAIVIYFVIELMKASKDEPLEKPFPDMPELDDHEIIYHKDWQKSF
jgi:hypothetical protein